MSQAPFSQSVRASIHQRYGNRCAICLSRLPEVGIQSTHLIDSAAMGEEQIDTAVRIGLLTPDYRRSAVSSGQITRDSSFSFQNMLTGWRAECPSCHLCFFMPHLIALSPALPVLKYINNYISTTPWHDRRPLHEVFALLRRAMAGEDVPLPNPTPILPYLSLFTIVILRPQSLIESFINTRHLPALSILQGNRFEFAPNGTLPGDENVARIFDVEWLNNQHPAPVSLGGIPLSPEDPDFAQQCYWRLPLPTEVILAALINQVERGDFESKEIRVAQAIYHRLMLERLELGDDGGAGPSHSGGPSSGPGRDRGTGRC